MYHFARENTTDFSLAQNCVNVIATGHELSVEVSSKEPDRNIGEIQNASIN